MAIDITKYLGGTAHHWHGKTYDAGKFTYDGVQTISVRWVNKAETIRNYANEQVSVTAEILTDTKVEEQELLQRANNGESADRTKAHSVQNVEEIVDIDGVTIIGYRVFL